MSAHWAGLGRKAWIGALAAAVVVPLGCAVGPNYGRPGIQSPDSFRGGPELPPKAAELTWFDVYQDPVLQGLVREALTNNYNLRAAVARIEQSRALAMQARAQFVPTINYGGTVSRGRNDVFGSGFANGGTTLDSAVATLNAAWEVDLWGRVRRSNEAARARLLASEEARRAIQLILLSDVASTYFQLLELNQELEIASQTTNSFGESLRIFNQRVEGGTAPALQTARAEAALDNAAAAVPSIRLRIATTENQLRLLLGRNPGPVERSASLLDQQLPEVPVGLPSQLLERRPDLRESEALLHSATAQVGESLGEFFPRIGLTAFLGKVSPELAAFTLGGANAWGIAAQGAGSLFAGGRLVGQLRQAKATRDEAELQYRQSVLTAFHEVSDALITRTQLADIRTSQAHEVKALEMAVKLSSERYSAGKASYYEVLEAQQQLFPAQLNLARTQRDQLLVVVELYKALGGGWPEKTEGMVTISNVR